MRNMNQFLSGSKSRLLALIMLVALVIAPAAVIFADSASAEGGVEVVIVDDVKVSGGGGAPPPQNPGPPIPDPDNLSEDDQKDKAVGVYTFRDGSRKLTKTARYYSGDKVDDHPLFGQAVNGCLSQNTTNKPVVGFTIRVLKNHASSWGQLYTCYFSTPVEMTYECIKYLDSEIEKITDASAPIQRFTGKKTPWGKASAKNQTRETCLASIEASIDTKADLKEQGRYVIPIRVHSDIVNFIKYTDHSKVGGYTVYNEKPTGMRTSTVVSKTRYAQVVCDANYTKVGNDRDAVFRTRPGYKWTYTETDCGSQVVDKDNATYSCVSQGNATIDGAKRNDASLFRDGKEIPVTFPTLSVKSEKTALGGGLIKVTSVETRVRRSGTPWNVAEKLSSGSNNFSLKYRKKNVLSSSKGTSWMGGNLGGKWYASANWASTEGQPTQLVKDIKVSGVWRTKVVRIVSITDKNIVVKYVNKDVKSTAMCSTKPVNLNYVRGVTNQ